MRTGRWLLGGIGALILLSPLILLTTCYYFENPTSRYETYHSAREAGAMEEGRWIPDFLPQSSRNIVETHDIDTNELEISFEYTSGDLGRLPAECDRAGTSLEFRCHGWGVPITVVLEPTGAGRVVSGVPK